MSCLIKFSQDYVRRRDLSKGYQHQILCTVRAFGRSMSKDPTVSDLSAQSINHLISAKSVSDETRNNRRRMLLTLAAEAARMGLIERIDPFFVQKIKRRKKLPKGYSIDQARQIIQAIAKPPKREKWFQFVYENGVRRRDWWLAYLLACWDSGAVQDMRLLTRDQIDPDGSYWFLRHKTGKVVDGRLSRPTLAAIKRIDRPRQRLLFPRWCNCKNGKCISEEFRVIAEVSECPGTLKYFRSGAGTNVEKNNPQSGHQFLANSRRVFEENYLVRSHLKGRDVISPEPLVDDLPD